MNVADLHRALRGVNPDSAVAFVVDTDNSRLVLTELSLGVPTEKSDVSGLDRHCVIFATDTSNRLSKG